MLHHLLLPPRAPGPRPPLLLLLHGVGRDETDLLGAVPGLDPRLLVVAARGPRPAGPGGFGWYDVDWNNDPPRKDPAQVLESRDQVIALLEQLRATQGADPERLFLLGFSQGAILSLAVALARPDLVRGVVAHSGRLLPESLPATPHPALPRLEVLLLHGLADQVILPVRSREALDRLAPLLGPRITAREFPGQGHALAPASVAAASAWLAARLGPATAGLIHV
jgi:phospholipase/carboxylesterase